MTILAFVVFSLCETGEQLCFAVSNRDAFSTWRWVTAGCALYVMSLCAWMWILGHLPLSIALPMAGLNYAVVAVAGRSILGEAISRRRALGIAIIIAGVVVIGLTGGGDFV